MNKTSSRTIKSSKTLNENFKNEWHFVNFIKKEIDKGNKYIIIHHQLENDFNRFMVPTEPIVGFLIDSNGEKYKFRGDDSDKVLNCIDEQLNYVFGWCSDRSIMLTASELIEF